MVWFSDLARLLSLQHVGSLQSAQTTRWSEQSFSGERADYMAAAVLFQTQLSITF